MVSFELTVDVKTGEPKIEFKHHDKSSELEQRLLKVFIDKAKSGGIEIVNTGGFLESGTTKSWENYEIRIKK